VILEVVVCVCAEVCRRRVDLVHVLSSCRIHVKLLAGSELEPTSYTIHCM